MRYSKLDAAFLRAHRSDARANQGGRCKYCLDKITAKTATADHVIPKKHGGVDRAFNIVAACRPCNKLKGHKPKGEYMAMLKSPPPGASLELLVRHMSYRINRAVRKAEIRISKAAGVAR